MTTMTTDPSRVLQGHGSQNAFGLAGACPSFCVQGTATSKDCVQGTATKEDMNFTQLPSTGTQPTERPPAAQPREGRSRQQTPMSMQLSDLGFSTTQAESSDDEGTECRSPAESLSPTSKLGSRFHNCGIGPTRGASPLTLRPMSRSKTEDSQGYESDESFSDSATPRSLRSARRPPPQVTASSVCSAIEVKPVERFMQMPFDLQFFVFNFLAAEDLARLRGVCKAMEPRVQETIKCMFLEHFGVWPEDTERRLKTDRLFWALKRIHHLNPKAAAELWFWSANYGFTKWLRRVITDDSVPRFKNGVNCQCVKENGMTALHLALKHGNLEIVRLLLDEGGANCNAEDRKGFRPLHAACMKKNEEAVRLLLDREDVDINATDKTLRTCLYMAAREGSDSLVSLLMSRGADPSLNNATDMSPLYIASERGHAAVVELLLEDERTDVLLTAKTGKSPVYIATEKNKPDVVRLLLDHGADVRQQTSRKKIPLYVAAELSFADVVKELLRYTTQKDIFWETTYGTTPMFIASKQSNKVVSNMFKAFCSRKNQAQARKAAQRIAEAGEGQGQLAMGDLRAKGKTGGKVDYKRVLEQKERPATPRFAGEMVQYEDHKQQNKVKVRRGPGRVPFSRMDKIAKEKEARLLSHPEPLPDRPKKKRKRSTAPKDDEKEAPAIVTKKAPIRQTMSLPKAKFMLSPKKNDKAPSPKKSAKRRRSRIEEKPPSEPPPKRFHFNPSRMFEEARKKQAAREEAQRATEEEERRRREAAPSAIDPDAYSRLVRRPVTKCEEQDEEEDSMDLDQPEEEEDQPRRWVSNAKVSAREPARETQEDEMVPAAEPMTREKFGDFMRRQNEMAAAHRQKKLDRLEQEKQRLLSEREALQRKREMARRRASKAAEKAKVEQALREEERRKMEAELEAEERQGGGIVLPSIPGAEALAIEEAGVVESWERKKRRNSLPDIFAMRRKQTDSPQPRREGRQLDIDIKRTTAGQNRSKSVQSRPRSSRSSKSARGHCERGLAVRAFEFTRLADTAGAGGEAAEVAAVDEVAQRRIEVKRRRAEKRRKVRDKLMSAYGFTKKKKRRRRPVQQVEQPETGNLAGLLSVVRPPSRE